MEILKQSGPPRPMALTFQAAARIAPGRPTMKSSGYGAAGDKSPLNGGAFDVPGDKPDFIGCCFVARALHARAGGLGSEPTYRLCVTKCQILVTLGSCARESAAWEPSLLSFLSTEGSKVS